MVYIEYILMAIFFICIFLIFIIDFKDVNNIDTTL